MKISKISFQNKSPKKGIDLLQKYAGRAMPELEKVKIYNTKKDFFEMSRANKDLERITQDYKSKSQKSSQGANNIILDLKQ